ncbi:MAG: flagellar biosynthetic protein FliO [Gammaproteobacteria bacterium]|nr:flagellar biosynthetic protein FliO [Gammaproteobacteria bacterium]
MTEKRKLINHDAKKCSFFFHLFVILIFFLPFNVSAIQNAETSALDQKQEIQAPTEKKKYSFLTNQQTSNSIINSGAGSQKQSTSPNADALSVSLGLIFILIIIFSLAWFMKKMGYSHVSGKGQLKIIASLNLGPKEKISVIQVGNQQLLVGMTSTQINTLHVLEEPLIESKSEIKGEVETDNHFANKLSEFLNNKQTKRNT